MKELKGDVEAAEEVAVLRAWVKAANAEAAAKNAIQTAEKALDTNAYAKYPELTKEDVKVLVVDEKWLATLSTHIHGELYRISQALSRRLKELAVRYETPLPEAAAKVSENQQKVNHHLHRLGFSWN